MTLAAQLFSIPEQLLWPAYEAAKQTPLHVLILISIALVLLGFFLASKRLSPSDRSAS
jgi:hypothetical protein